MEVILRMNSKDNSFRCNSSMAHKQRTFSWVPRFAVILAVVSFSYYLLSCIIYIKDAYDDFLKYSSLGFLNPYGYYFDKIPFFHTLCMAVIVIIELFLFIILVIKRNKAKPPEYGLPYFAVIVLIHFVVFILTCRISIPDSPPFIAENGFGRPHKLFALETCAQSLLYYLSAIIRFRQRQGTELCPDNPPFDES